MSNSISDFSFKTFSDEIIESKSTELTHSTGINFLGSALNADLIHKIFSFLNKEIVEHLDFAACRLKDPEIIEIGDYIQGFNNLKSLSIRTNEISSMALRLFFQKISHCPKLETLDLSYLKFGVEAEIELTKLLGFDHIDELNVRYCKFTDQASFFYGLNPLTTLKKIDLSCLTLTQTNLIHLPLSLKALYLDASHLKSCDLSAINLPSLEKVSFDLIESDSDLNLESFLSKHDKLTYLNLARLNLRPEGLFKLKDALYALTYLEELNLHANKLTDLGLDILLASIPKSVKKLNLSHNYLTEDSIAKLIAFLKEQPLEILFLQSNFSIDSCVLRGFFTDSDIKTTIIFD